MGGTASMKNAQDEDFASDVLYGAKAIARFLFGTEAEAMKVYRLGEALPLFKLNGVICGRKDWCKRTIGCMSRKAAGAAFGEMTHYG